MDSASSPQLILLVICIIFSAFFSMSETALTSLSKIRLRTLVDENVKNAALVQRITSNPNKLLSTILIGNNIVNIGASSIATSLTISLCESLNIPSANGIGISTGLMTLIVLIFGEITPKTYAAQNSEKVSFMVIKLIAFFCYVFTPFVFVLNIVTGFFLKLLGVNASKKAPAITESELKTMVNVSHEEGVLEIDEREMINNVVDFGNCDAKDVMIPRTDVIAVEVGASYDEVIGIFREERFSKMPVYNENIDNIVGIVSYKDVFFLDNKDEFVLEKVMREPFFTYESKSSRELFNQMKTERFSMAIVLDEYGGTSGIITIEDLVEEIVGEITDEDDEDNEEIQVIKENEYIVDGSTKIDDVNDMIGTKFESEDFDSIGGYVVGVLGRFPEKGESVESDNVKFVIEEVDKNRIEKLRILT